VAALARGAGEHFHDVPAAERAAIAGENAAALYHLD